MPALSTLGRKAERICRDLGCSRHTVHEYLRQGGRPPPD
jgi:predicted transcriptional regulator YheO